MKRRLISYMGHDPDEVRIYKSPPRWRVCQWMHQGHNTTTIADHLGLKEFVIYNILASGDAGTGKKP